MNACRYRGCVAIFLGGMLSLSGCLGPGPKLGTGPVLEPLSEEDAIRLVNDNIAKIGGTLRATGPVDGHFAVSGSRRRVSYNVDGTLFFLSPTYLRFDLKKLGDRQALFGSNREFYWTYNKDDDRYVCGHLDDSLGSQLDIPIPPSQIADAMGLNPIVVDGVVTKHRVHAEYQSVMMGNREFWLDRRAPRQIRKIIFRDARGKIVMTSDLSDYRPVDGAAQLPYIVDAQWPDRNARMKFDVGRWSVELSVKPDGPQFATPTECADQLSGSFGDD